MNIEARKGVSERLKAARQSANLTQAQVALDFLVSRQAVSAWETGKNLPSTSELWSLCLLYGVSADYLLFGMKTVPASSAAVVQDLFRQR